MSQLLSAIETLAENDNIRHATIAIRVDSDAAVDELYADLGEPVKGRFERPYDDLTSDGNAYERKAVTSVLGVTIVVTGPFQLVKAKEAA